MGTKTIYEDGTYFDNNPTWHEEDSPWKAKQIEKILRKNNVDPSTICEVGCGIGEILNCLANSYGGASMAFGWSPVGLKSDVSLNLSDVLLLEADILFSLICYKNLP